MDSEKINITKLIRIATTSISGFLAVSAIRPNALVIFCSINEGAKKWTA